MKRILLSVSMAAGMLMGLMLAVQAQDSPLSALVSCWELSETDGTRYDYWGGNDLTDFNTVGSSPGYVNELSANFVSANNEHLDVADTVAMRTDGGLHVVAWFNADVINVNAVILAKWEQSPTYLPEYQLGQDTSNRLFWRVSTGATHSSVYSSTFAVSSWYMVDAYYDEAQSTIGIAANNGAHTFVGSVSPVTGTAAFQIGTRDYALYWDGRVGPVMLFDRVLTDSERDYLWNDGAGLSCATLTGDTGLDYAVQQVMLPSGRLGAVEMRLSVGEIAIAAGLIMVVLMGVFWIIRDTVRSSKVGDK